MTKKQKTPCRGNLKKTSVSVGKGDKDVVVATDNQKTFWEYIANGRSKKDAYILAYPDSDPKYASQYANKLWNNDKFQRIKEDISENLWEQYRKDAGEAYIEQKRILRDKYSSNKLKNDIANKIQDRAGYSPVQKSMSVSKNMNEDIEDMPIKQLIEESKRNLREIQNVTNEIKKLESGESNKTSKVKKETK